MVPILSLWLPIILSAVFVFVASSILHMLLPFHRKDYRKVPNEDKVIEALRPLSIPPGDYMLPCPESTQGMKDPAFVDKLNKGPVGVFTILPNGSLSMGWKLVQWYLYSIIVGVFSAYVAGRALAAGSDYLAVFRFAGVAAFLGYALALWQDSIWYGRSWGTTTRNTIDGLIYGLLTAGTFGWLWPR